MLFLIVGNRSVDETLAAPLVERTKFRVNVFGERLCPIRPVAIVGLKLGIGLNYSAWLPKN